MANSPSGQSGGQDETTVPVFVPVALKLDQVEALQAAAYAVLQSFITTKRAESEYAPLKEALRTLEDALDKKLMRDALTGGGGRPGEVLLQRIQREFRREENP